MKAINIFLIAFLLLAAETTNAQTTIAIGTQTWMSKNLDVVTYRNGDIIPEVSDLTQWSNLTTGAWCYYNNDPALGPIYGKLYNWYAVNDPRGLSPIGWHIPAADEWTTLINFLGGYNVAGGKMKESGTAHWISPNIDANNSSGFSALPGGTWTSLIGGFNSLGSAGFWWGSTPVNGTSSTIVGLYKEYGSIGMWNGNNNLGVSARCIRDGCSFPVIQCIADTVLNAVGNHCGVIVRYNPPVVIEACGTSTIKQISGLASGAFFPIGLTVNRFVAISPSGKNDTCSFRVTVKDTKSPFITPVRAYPATLWPPNHKMKDVYLFYFSWDDCGAASCSLDVSSNEHVSGTGRGDLAPDWMIVSNHLVKLRAERSGHGNGRKYTITVTCKDASGITATQKTNVFVPHDSYGHYSKGQSGFNGENGGYIDANGDFIDNLLDAGVTPNPSNQNFRLEIRTSSNENIEVRLYEISGRFISKLSAVKNQIYRFGDDLRPGVYMVEIRQGQQKRMIKVIKQ